MSDLIARKVSRIMAIIDREGMPPLSQADWISMLEEIRSGCQSRLGAVLEDQAREPPNKPPNKPPKLRVKKL